MCDSRCDKTQEVNVLLPFQKISAAQLAAFQ